MAANPDKGEIDLAIDGKTYTLVVKTQALMAWQRYFETTEGRPSIDTLFAALFAGSIEHAVAMFWASFRKYHPEVTFDKAVGLMDELGGLPAVRDVMAAFQESNTPDAKDAEELNDGSDPPTAQPGTGEPSSSKPVAVG